MISIVLLSCVAVALSYPAFPDPELDTFWTSFKSQHGKLYGGQPEEKMRRFVWEKNVKYIVKHNLEADMGLHTFTLGMNKYGDLTSEEFAKYLTGIQPRINKTRGAATFLAPDNIDLPDTVDWTKEGYVTPVKDQGHSGSSWAFSATGSLEGQTFKKTGKLVSLSEQQLVDCSKEFGNDGCNGGSMNQAFKYIKANGGIDTETSYPYTAKDGDCHYKPSDVGATCTGFVDVVSGSEADLQKAVASVGPISVAIDASQPTFQLYRSGVYVEPACSSHVLDHDVLAVGYGELDGSKYWLVKNSWNVTWGNKGYIMMARNHNNMCGIATQASYPLV